MKKYFLAISLIAVCSCCTIKETDQGTQKKIADLEAEGWTLRTQKDSLIHLSDSLRIELKDCREDNRQLEYWKSK
jgi:hypothetical protein